MLVSLLLLSLFIFFFVLASDFFLPSTARGRQLEPGQWLRTHEGFKLNAYIFGKACQGGNLEVIKWLRSEDCPWNEWACAGAAKGGHLEILKWLRSEGFPWDEDACSGAAMNGHLEILKWLKSEGCPRIDREACAGAAEHGHLEILK